jgi:hypothetical protein
MRVFWAGGVILAFALCACGGEPAGKLVREYWDAAFLGGEKAGYFHTTVVESKRGDQTVLRVTRELQLSMKRYNDVAQLRASTGNEETPDGKLLGVFMTQDLAQNKQIKLIGRVVNGVLNDSIDDPNIPKANQVQRQIPLPEDIVTYLSEESLIKQKQAKPGDRLTYRLFEATVNNVIQVQVDVKGYEQVPLDGVNRKLLRVVVKPEKIQGVQLPSVTTWYDEKLEQVLSETEIPGLGELTLRRTSKEKAQAPNGKLRDLGDQSVVLNRSMYEAHTRAKVTYKVTFAKEIEDAEKLFSVGDNRQSVQKVTPRGLELVITAQRKPPTKESNTLVPAEYLKSNFFINSADEKVQELAAKAVGEITEPWEKAKAIERWVHNNMHGVAFTEAMAPADHVARTLTGDCTEYSMLAAAMCRAQGVPSRTAIGLVPAGNERKLAFHMWTEVFVRGEWLALDATMGRGSVGPCHVKITDHSWHEVRSMTPLLPVMRVMMAKPRMEVIEVK